MKHDIRKYIKSLKSQNGIECCTASASLLAIEMMLAKEGKHINFSRLYVYYMSQKIQEKFDGGCRLSSTFSSLKTYGACIENLWPFSIYSVGISPPRAAIENGVQNKLIEYSPVGINEINKYIIDEVPVIIGINVGSLFYKVSGSLENQIYKPINQTDNIRHSGHAATIVGFDDSLAGGSWIIANSFGQHWGNYGFGILPYSCHIDIGEAYVIQRFAGLGADKKISDF